MKKITIAIDASNISQGGGVTHLTQMLSALDIEKTNIGKILVWAPEGTINRYPDRFWLNVKSPFWVNGNPLLRFFVQLFLFPFLAKSNSCEIIFSPGGLVSIFKLVPVVAMSQNLLPFELSELDRFGVFSRMWFKLKILRVIQSLSFKKSDGLIFLTGYARECVSSVLSPFLVKSVIIPHGVDSRFFVQKRIFRDFPEYSFENPFRLLYVSISMPYKHQIQVASAVKIVRERGLPVEIKFVGPEWGWYHGQLMRHINQLDPSADYIKWVGAVDFSCLHQVYSDAEAFVFASSCENMPNILIEAMGSGLPIASSGKGPMPEVLGDCGVYFDPLHPESIADAINFMARNSEMMINKSRDAVCKASEYTWEACARKTFDFVELIAGSKAHDVKV